MNITELADDVLLNVFGKLDLTSRAHCERVCRRWRILMRTVNLLEPLEMKLSLQSTKTVANYVAESPFARGQFERGYQDEVCISTLEAAAKFLKKYNQGKQLTISFSDWRQVKPALSLLRKWTKLKKVDVEIRKEDGIGRMLDGISRHVVSPIISHIYIDLCYLFDLIGDAHVKKIFNSCTNLESLVVHCDNGVTVESVVKLPPKLRTLMIDDLCLPTDDVRQFLAGDAKQLREFKIVLCNLQHLQIICETMSELTTFILDIEDDDENMPEKLLPVSKLEHLENFGFKHFPDSNDLFFTKETEEPCKGVAEALLDILSKCTKLKRLAVSECCCATEFFTELPKFAPSLELLYIFFSDNGDYKCKLDQNCLDALLSLDKLKSITAPVERADGAAVVEFVDKSTTLRHFGFGGLSKRSAMKLFKSMTQKAKENASARFYLDIDLKLNPSTSIPPNLQLASQLELGRTTFVHCH